MKNSKARIFATLLLSLNLSGALRAAPVESKDKDGYQYPELLVVPKASQKLATEANIESKTRFRTHFILQAPAFMSLLVGVGASSMKDAKSKEAGAIASGVGLGWLVATLGMSAMYTPYRSGHLEVNALGEKSQEQILAKERRAEEALYFPAYLMRRVQYISAITNLGAAAAVMSLEEENPKIKALAMVAAATSLLPLIFDHPWITNYDQQQEYKKKIYGPVAQLTMLSRPQTNHWVPGLELSFRF